MMDSDFSGKVVVVTGGASGIGRAIAEAFAAAGALLAVMDVDHEQTAGLLDVLAGEGHICVTGDAGVEEDLRFFAEKVLEHFGRVDVLVNNACISRRGILSGCSYEEFNKVLCVGVSAPYLLSSLFLEHFSRGASIVNISFQPRVHVSEGYGELQRRERRYPRADACSRHEPGAARRAREQHQPRLD